MEAQQGEIFFVWVEIGNAALIAQNADEALGHDGLNGGRDQEGLDAHIDQTGNGRRGVVRVQRRENQMPRECRLNGDFGDFEVADFADENDVGGLTQHRPEDSCEAQPDLFLHLALVDAGEVVFDGVFGGDDFGGRLFVEFHGGAAVVERRRLARQSRWGRNGDEEDAVGSGDDAFEAAP